MLKRKAIKRMITEVQKRPILWKNLDKNYQNPATVDKLWEEVANAVGSPVEDVKKKWHHYHASYLKYLLNIIAHPKSHLNEKYKRPPRYISLLAFMINDLGLSSDELSMIKKVEEGCNSKLTRVYPDTNPIKYERKPFEYQVDGSLMEGECSRETIETLLESFSKDFVSLEKEKNEIVHQHQDCDDILFFKSLLPLMKSLDPSRKFILRTKIQQFVCDFLYSNQSSFC